MRVHLTCLLTALLFSQASVLSAEDSSREMQHFLDREWGFECRFSGGNHIVRAVCARQVEEARAREFLGSLPALGRLNIEFSSFGPGDIRSLARRCPSLYAIHITGQTLPMVGGVDPAPQLEAALWPEFFEFQGLKHLSVKHLYFSGGEKWSGSHITELETLKVSGNLSGMLPTLLAPCKVRSLRIEFRRGKQRLTAADIAALNSHPEIESLAIHGSPLGSDIFVDLNALSEMRRLRRLTLEQCWIDPMNLHRFPVLKVLSLQRCRFIKHDFDALLAHPRLEQLVLSECSNEGLRIAGPYPTPPGNLHAITIRSPVVAEIGSFPSLSCSYHVELRPGTCYGRHNSRVDWVGSDEIASLEKLGHLRSLSVCSGPGSATKVSTAALARLTRINTLRRLEVVDVDLVQDAPSGKHEQGSGLEEVRFVTRTPLNQKFVTRLLGANTCGVFVGDYSGKAYDASLRGNTTHISPKEVGLVGITLPVSTSSLYGRLLTSSVEDLVLDSCDINKGAIAQLVSKSSSLKRLTLNMCSLQDEQELLLLNELKNLEWVDFENTTVSARTARSMKAKSIRFGSRWIID